MKDTDLRSQIRFNDTVLSNDIADIVITAPGILKGKRLGEVMSLRNMEQIGELLQERDTKLKEALLEALPKGLTFRQLRQATPTYAPDEAVEVAKEVANVVLTQTRTAINKVFKEL